MKNISDINILYEILVTSIVKSYKLDTSEPKLVAEHVDYLPNKMYYVYVSDDQKYTFYATVENIMGYHVHIYMKEKKYNGYDLHTILCGPEDKSGYHYIIENIMKINKK